MHEQLVPHSAHGLDINPIIYNKYLANLRLGRRTHAMGDYKPLTKPPSDNPDGIAIRAFFTGETNGVLTGRLVGPIERLALEQGVNIYSGDLWTLHTTISNLVYLHGVTPGSREEVFKQVAMDQRVQEAIENLQGLLVDFDVLFGGNTIVTAASRLPTQILEARRQMTQVAMDLSMGENDYSNILHISLARIAASKEEYSPRRNSNSFGRGLMRLHCSLRGQPVSAQISYAEMMSDQEFVKKHEARLFKALSI